MWWALLYCMLLPLFLCEQVEFTGIVDTNPNPNVNEEPTAAWSSFCVETPKIPSISSHASIDVTFEFDNEVLDILVYWGNSTEVCTATSTVATKQITITVAHNGTSLCNWDIKQLNSGKFVGMMSTTIAILTNVTVFERAEEFIDIAIIKPCPRPHFHNPDTDDTSKTSAIENFLPYEDEHTQLLGSDVGQWKPDQPFPFASVVESELGYLVIETTNEMSNEETTIFNLLFGMSLGACFLVIVMTLFFANCAFISGKKKKKPVYVSAEHPETYYLPAVAFTPTENDTIEYFVQPPPMNVVRPDASLEPSSQFDALQPTVLTQPIKYFNLLYLLKHVVHTRNPVVTESI